MLKLMETLFFKLLCRTPGYGRVTGRVFRPWGECSQDVHTMVQHLAKAKVKLADTQPGQCHRPLLQSLIGRHIICSRTAEIAGLLVFKIIFWDRMIVFCFLKLPYPYHNLDITLLLFLTSIQADASNSKLLENSIFVENVHLFEINWQLID